MLPGVYTATKKDGTIYYRSSITYQNKHISLGSYASEDTANQAYQKADALLRDPSVSLSTHLRTVVFYLSTRRSPL
ncbi:MAG: hypothetical protein V8S31_05680 [Lachnospiraceae bacterium]